MKSFVPFSVLILLIAATANTQSVGPVDTLIFADFESGTPIDLPVKAPAGDDIDWISYDQDGLADVCFYENPDSATHGWFGTYDLTDISQTTNNLAFTSCSWIQGDQIYPCNTKNRNWLILPPVAISGTVANLYWKSASITGPRFVDGYKVLVSTTTNLPAAFTDTLFVAAEMIRPKNNSLLTSLNPDDFVFSPGYIHADQYTQTEFFVPYSDFFGDYYHGLFEPHSVDLSPYSGQNIYIAFLHDSQCDNLLQIDDIIVTDNKVDAVTETNNIESFAINPNPTDGFTAVQLTLKNNTTLQVSIDDLSGKNLLNLPQIQASSGKNTLDVSLEMLPKGIYTLTLKTPSGNYPKKIVKI